MKPITITCPYCFHLELIDPRALHQNKHQVVCNSCGEMLDVNDTLVVEEEEHTHNIVNEISHESNAYTVTITQHTSAAAAASHVAAAHVSAAHASHVATEPIATVNAIGAGSPRMLQTAAPRTVYLSDEMQRSPLHLMRVKPTYSLVNQHPAQHQAYPPTLFNARLHPLSAQQKHVSTRTTRRTTTYYPAAKKSPTEPVQEEFNWTLASLVALTVLILQLFYLVI